MQNGVRASIAATHHCRWLGMLNLMALTAVRSILARTTMIAAPLLWWQHYSLFNRDIVNPIRKFGYIGAGRAGFLALKRGVLDKVLLRRTKVQAGTG